MRSAARTSSLWLRAFAVLAVCMIGLRVSSSQSVNRSRPLLLQLSLYKLNGTVAAHNKDFSKFFDGHMVIHFDRSTKFLRISGTVIGTDASSLRERWRTWLADPDLAVLLMLAGGLLIYLEFNVPGTVLPGALGTLCLLTGMYGLSLLPLRHTAVALLVAAVAMILLQTKFASHGVLATVGTSCLIAGLATLVDSPVPGLRVHLSTAIAAGLSFGVISFFLGYIALRARRNKMRTGPGRSSGAACRHDGRA